MRLLEVPVYTVESGIAAFEGGADRLELCSHLESGGETPELEMAEAVLKRVSIPCMIMIRPRGGNFIYTNEEKEIMKQQIISFLRLPVEGFVFGAFSKSNVVDVDFCKELISVAEGRPCTFHRAIDVATNPLSILEDVISCGFGRVLTSGGAKTAVGGIENIKKMIALAAGRIIIMPGSGLRPENINAFISIDGISEFHASCGKPEISKAGRSFLSSGVGETDKQMVSEMVKRLKA